MAILTCRPRNRLSKERLRVFRHQQAQKARQARRVLDRNHQQLPKQARALFDPLAPAFTRPTYRRFALLAVAAILTLGGHTICNLLRCLGALAPGHPSSYHRVFSRSPWSCWHLARRFTRVILARFAPKDVIELAGDDTVAEHPGPKIYGKGCHRDPVRSTHSFTAFRWGHKWVVLALLVRFPFATRRWALPLLMALYQPEEENRRQKRRHKTPPELLRQMLLMLMRWFPDRRFVCTADGNYATHDLAELATHYSQAIDLHQQVLPRCQLGGPTAGLLPQGASSSQGEEVARPCRNGREHREGPTIGSRLVWGRPAPR